MDDHVDASSLQQEECEIAEKNGWSGREWGVGGDVLSQKWSSPPQGNVFAFSSRKSRALCIFIAKNYTCGQKPGPWV